MANSCILNQAAQAYNAGTIRLCAETTVPTVLTQAQREFYNENGYLVLPNALTAKLAAESLEEVCGVMKCISEGGEGVIRHDASSGEGEIPSPIGRVLVTFETGQSPNLLQPKVCIT